MKLTIIPEDGYIAVDGEGFTGMDMTGVAENIHAVQFDGNEGWIEFKRNATPPQRIVTVQQFQAIINRHAAHKAEQAALAANPFHGMTEAAAIALAINSKVTQVAAESATRQAANIVVNGRTYYADAWATKTLESALSTAVALGLSDSDPVRVPPPLQPGYWMTADLDTGGNRIAAPMTIGGLKTVVVALYDRNGLIWGRELTHYATLEALPAMGWTAQQIMAYDITQGW